MKIIPILIVFFAQITISSGQVIPTSKISQLSYENRHQNYSHTASMPDNANARAIFKYPDGALGLVVNRLVSWPTNATRETAQPASLAFYRQADGYWAENTQAVFDQANSVPGCLHPRKAIAADYNQDGTVDFAIACHGWDAPPFAGERSRVILSQPSGKYQMDYLSTVIDFQHSGTSADLNSDGYPDLIMTSITGVDVLLNDKTGHFVRSTDLAITQQQRPSHVELVDLNGDGKFDFVQGGHEWKISTRITINPGNNNFNSSLFSRPTEIVIPPVPGGGVITDFLFVKSVNALYILRTGDGRSNGSTFYQGVWLQKFTLDTRTSTVVYANPNWSELGNPWNKWIDWIIQNGGFITSNVGELIKVPIQ